MLFLVVGAIASYMKFFHGRIFVERACLVTTAKVIRSNTEKAMLVHAIRCEIENKGTTRLKIESLLLGTFPTLSSVVSEGRTTDPFLPVWSPQEDARRYMAEEEIRPGSPRFIDSGEKESYLFIVSVPEHESEWVVHQVHLKCKRHYWRDTIAVRNELPSGAQE